MKKFSNTYIFIYSAILVAAVAVLLSLVATSLKNKQQANVTNEKMQSLLKAINVDVERDAAPEAYKQYFTEELTVTTAGAVENSYSIADGEQTQGSLRPFDVNLKEEQRAEGQQAGTGHFPVYRYAKDGKSGIVLPLRGTGLWGPIWGYIALAEDCNTVEGVTFDHEGETPGLGAEISNHDKFQAPFFGKQILDEQGQVVSIAVKKHANKDCLHEVDALSGGTMTSNGVNEMLAADLMRYQKYFDQLRNK